MRVSVLTIHDANNVGAFLQAYSLQKVMLAFPDVEEVSFLRFRSQGRPRGKIQKALGYLKQRELGKVIYKYKSAKNTLHSPRF